MNAIAQLCQRVPEVATLRDRIDCKDFPTRQECADARYFLVTGGRVDLLTTTKGISSVE